MFYLSTLTPNEFDELSFTMSPWRFAVLAACIAFVEGKPHQMPKMPGGALASWGCWKAGKRQRRARDLGRGDHEIWWDAMPISSMYGIYANIGGILMINVTIYSIHGSYGMGMNGNIMRVFEGMQWDYNQLWVFLGLSKNKGSPPPHLHLLGKMMIDLCVQSGFPSFPFALQYHILNTTQWNTLECIGSKYSSIRVSLIKHQNICKDTIELTNPYIFSRHDWCVTILPCLVVNYPGIVSGHRPYLAYRNHQCNRNLTIRGMKPPSIPPSIINPEIGVIP